tara:strand:- start:9202 stop:10527 length:1326 start_codon:yes stop_codon:yes gene_type:complete
MQNKAWFKDLMHFLRLSHEQEDTAIIHNTVENGVVFRGTNLWILIFAILIASVGLNMNSTAVVIGAMLISPLMGPITGVGYSIATYNFPLLRKSLKNFGFSASAAIITSFIYFMLTPIHAEHSEILARTSPTIYDVFIAFFGGLAGIVAISSKNKGNVIPGVAIATALMPPLCTAGYGLAMGNLVYFFGALYLFTINSVFIALSAMVVAQLLKLPKKTFLLSKEIKNKNIVISIVILLTIVPSFFLGLGLVRKEKFNAKADQFIKKVTTWEGNYLLRNNVNAETKEIKLVYVGNEFDENTADRINDKADDMGLIDVSISIEQGVKIKDYDEIIAKDADLKSLSSEYTQLQLLLLESNNKVDSLETIPKMGNALLKEIKSFFPNITGCSYSVTEMYIDSLQEGKPISLIFFNTIEEITQDEKIKIKEWLKSRLNTNNFILKF